MLESAPFLISGNIYCGSGYPILSYSHSMVEGGLELMS